MHRPLLNTDLLTLEIPRPSLTAAAKENNDKHVCVLKKFTLDHSLPYQRDIIASTGVNPGVRMIPKG